MLPKIETEYPVPAHIEDWLRRQNQTVYMFYAMPFFGKTGLAPAQQALLMEFLETCAAENVKLDPKYLNRYEQAWNCVKASKVLTKLTLRRFKNPEVQAILQTCKALRTLFAENPAKLGATEEQTLWAEVDFFFRVRDPLDTIAAWLRGELHKLKYRIE